MSFEYHFERSEKRYKEGAIRLFCYRLTENKAAASQLSIQPNWHNEMEILCTDAALTLYINEEEFVLEPGDICFINPLMIHRAYRKSAGDIFAVVFDLDLLKMPDEPQPLDDWVKELSDRKRKIVTRPDQDSSFYRELSPAVRRLTEFADRPIMTAENKCCVMGCLYAIFAACFRWDCFEDIPHRGWTRSQTVSEAVEYIDAHYAEKLSASILAEKLNLSESTLFHLFQDYIGMTPNGPDPGSGFAPEAGQKCHRNGGSRRNIEHQLFHKAFQKNMGKTPPAVDQR